jgi:uncharacterized protein YpiB (UPF0302 family)
MNGKVTLEEKKKFIEWFVENEKYENTVGQNILKLLLTNNEIVENLIFVESDNKYPNFLHIASCEEYDGNLFHRNEVEVFMTVNPKAMLKKIKRKKEEVLYIQIDFENKSNCWKYLSVKEIDTYDPTEGNIVKEAEGILKRFSLLSKLDESLKNKDENLFNKTVIDIKKEKIVL